MEPEKADNPRPRRSFFGVGTLSAFVIVAAMFGMRALQERPTPADTAQPRAYLDPGDAEGPTPEVSYILSHRAELNLTADQTERLKKISASEASEMAPVQKEIDAVTKDFERWLAERSEKANPGQTIGAASPDLGAASRRAAAIREKYWSQAQKVLLAEQREKLTGIRRADMRKTIDRLRG